VGARRNELAERPYSRVNVNVPYPVPVWQYVEFNA
jgi:hypothetical protein